MLKDQEGFGLIELMIAIVILTVAILGVAGSTSNLTVQAAQAEVRAKAMQAVDDRMSKIMLDPRYSLVDSLYEGADSAVAGLPGFIRTTAVDTVTATLSGGASVTYQRVTVSVAGPGLSGTMARTAVLGAP